MYIEKDKKNLQPSEDLQKYSFFGPHFFTYLYYIFFTYLFYIFIFRKDLLNTWQTYFTYLYILLIHRNFGNNLRSQKFETWSLGAHQKGFTTVEDVTKSSADHYSWQWYRHHAEIILKTYPLLCRHVICLIIYDVTIAEMWSNKRLLNCK